MSEHRPQPKQWRGAFVHYAGGTMILMDTEGTTYRARTPDELWAMIEDLSRATNKRPLDFTHIGNLAPARAAAQDRKIERQIKARLANGGTKRPITLDDILGDLDI